MQKVLFTEWEFAKKYFIYLTAYMWLFKNYFLYMMTLRVFFLPISSSLDSPHKLVQHYDIVSLITTTQYSSISFPKKLHILSVQSWFTSTVKNNIHVNTEAVTCSCFIPACIPSIPVVSSWYRLGVKQLLWWYLLRPKWWEISWKPQLSFTLLH